MARRTACLLTAAGLALGACSSGNDHHGTETTGTTTTSPKAGVEAAVHAALVGVPEASYVVGYALVPGHADWVRFTTKATHETAGSFQGGYGFARQRSGTWVVVASGSALVGCPLPDATIGGVPSAVLAAAGERCPKR